MIASRFDKHPCKLPVDDWYNRKRREVTVEKDSYIAHHKSYVASTVDSVRQAHLENTKNKVQYRPDNPIGNVVDKISSKVKIAVDVGAGVGWGSDFLAKKFDEVYAIEPSEAALKIAKALYGDNEKIVWMKGFAEEEMAKLDLEGPALFYAACVLSHLSDSTVTKICKAINNIAKPQSVLSFSENWGITLANHCWYSRSQEWWREQFPDWDFKFGEAPGAPMGVKKGIVAVRRK